HPGIIDYKGKTYFFYHNGVLPTGGNYRRSVCVDYLHYNADGTIQKIIQTTQGVKAK
ncbi:MAG: glycoside hydrolase, partial [Bacteroidota bacterium]|nr:glycoside hydrolase [Bacteroidota bacterium]